MTFREVTLAEILAALGDGGEDSVLRACVAALRAYPRPSYTIGGSPARAVRETLEVKYRHAASRGKTFLGKDELLLRLHELGSKRGRITFRNQPAVLRVFYNLGNPADSRCKYCRSTRHRLNQNQPEWLLFRIQYQQIGALQYCGNILSLPGKMHAFL